MSNAKKLLFLLSTILVSTAVLHALTNWFPLMVISLTICPGLLYLSLGFCNRCREHGSDCTCANDGMAGISLGRSERSSPKPQGGALKARA